MIGTQAEELLKKFFNDTYEARLTSGQAKHLLKLDLICQAEKKDLYRLTSDGMLEYSAWKESRNDIPRPHTTTYDGAELVMKPVREGAADFLKCPSRRGNTLVYRNESIPILTMGSMTAYVEKKWDQK